MADQTIKKLLFLQGAKATAVKWVYQRDTRTASEAAADIELQLRGHCELASTPLYLRTLSCRLKRFKRQDSVRRYRGVPLVPNSHSGLHTCW